MSSANTRLPERRTWLAETYPSMYQSRTGFDYTRTPSECDCSKYKSASVSDASFLRPRQPEAETYYEWSLTSLSVAAQIASWDGAYQGLALSEILSNERKAKEQSCRRRRQKPRNEGYQNHRSCTSNQQPGSVCHDALTLNARAIPPE